MAEVWVIAAVSGGAAIVPSEVGVVGKVCIVAEVGVVGIGGSACGVVALGVEIAMGAQTVVPVGGEIMPGRTILLGGGTVLLSVATDLGLVVTDVGIELSLGTLAIELTLLSGGLAASLIRAIVPVSVFMISVVVVGFHSIAHGCGLGRVNPLGPLNGAVLGGTHELPDHFGGTGKTDD